MRKLERLALQNLALIISKPSHLGQLEIARKLTSSLNLSVELWLWNKPKAGVKEAIAAFNISRYGPEPTADCYLLESEKQDPPLEIPSES